MKTKKKENKTIRVRRKDVSRFSKRYWLGMINIGTGVAGSTAGTLVGGVVGGPAGAIAGGIVANLLHAGLKKVVTDQLRRKLSTFEELRTGQVLLQFRSKVIQNLSQGHTLRQDGFLSSDINERSAAEEIFEGVLLAAQREYEEKKLKYEGNFFANIAFEPNIHEQKIDRAYANFLLRLAQSLSYRQLCIVALFVQKEKFQLRNISYRNIERFYDFKFFTVLQDIYLLYSQGLLFIDEIALVSPFDIIPAKMVAKGPIKTLYSLMGLEEIDLSDIHALAEQLSR